MVLQSVVYGGTVCPLFISAVLCVDAKIVRVGVHVVLTSVRVGRVDVYVHVVDVLGGHGVVFAVVARHTGLGQGRRRRCGRISRRARIGRFTQVLRLFLVQFTLELKHIMQRRRRRVMVVVVSLLQVERLLLLLLVGMMIIVVVVMVHHQELFGRWLLWLRRYLNVRG